MKIVLLVFEDLLFLSCPTGFRQEFRDLRVLKIDSLSSDTPSSPSSLMTCSSFKGSIAHHMKSAYIRSYLWHLCCCTSPKPLVQIRATGHERKKYVLKHQYSLQFMRTQLSLFMRIISVYADDLCLQTSAPYWWRYYPHNFSLAPKEGTNKFPIIWHQIYISNWLRHHVW